MSWPTELLLNFEKHPAPCHWLLLPTVSEWRDVKFVNVSENKIDEDFFFMTCIIIYQSNVIENMGRLQIGRQFEGLVVFCWECKFNIFFTLKQSLGIHIVPVCVWVHNSYSSQQRKLKKEFRMLWWQLARICCDMCGMDLSSWDVCCVTVNMLRTCNLMYSNVAIGDCFIVICVFECILLIIRPPPPPPKKKIWSLTCARINLNIWRLLCYKTIFEMHSH